MHSGNLLNDGYIAAIGEFIRSNCNVKTLVMCSYGSSISEGRASKLSETLKFNTQLTQLKFYGAQPAEKITRKIKTLLLQNKHIVKLRKYVKDHPLVCSAGFPLDIVPGILDEIIVAYLKDGHTYDATKKAIDEFLVAVSVKALQDESKI